VTLMSTSPGAVAAARAAAFDGAPAAEEDRPPLGAVEVGVVFGAPEVEDEDDETS